VIKPRGIFGYGLSHKIGASSGILGRVKVVRGVIAGEGGGRGQFAFPKVFNTKKFYRQSKLRGYLWFENQEGGQPIHSFRKIRFCAMREYTIPLVGRTGASLTMGKAVQTGGLSERQNTRS